MKKLSSNIDVCFIDPYRGQLYSYAIASENLGISYIASVLEKKGYSVDLIDCDTFNLSPKDAVFECLQKGPKIIGFTVHTWKSINPALKIVKLLRQEKFRGHIIFGGKYPTLCYSKILHLMRSLVDSICIGEGEETMLELANCLLKNKVNDWTQIDGLAYLINDNVQVNPPRKLNYDLDKLPYPKRFNAPQILRSNAAFSVLGSRGCWYGQCLFCSVSRMEFNKERRRRSEEIVKEILFLMDKYGVSDFMIVGDSFIGPGEKGRRELENFIEVVKKSGRHFTFGFACQAKDVDLKTFLKLKKIGLTSVFIGIESGSESDLKFYRKNSTLTDNQVAANILKELNLNEPEGMGVGGFIFYNPESTMKDIKDNLDFLEKYGSKCDINFFTHCRILEGSPLEEKMIAENRLTSFDWKGYHIRDPLVQLIDSLIHPIRKIVTKDIDNVLIYQFKLFRVFANQSNDNTSKNIRKKSKLDLLASCSNLRKIILSLYKNIILYIENNDLSPIGKDLNLFQEKYRNLMVKYVESGIKLAQNNGIEEMAFINNNFLSPSKEWTVYFTALKNKIEISGHSFGYGEV